MALIKNITDEKGVSTEYHIVSGYSTDFKTIKVEVANYVNKRAFDKEQEIIEENKKALAYDKEISELKNLIEKRTSEISKLGTTPDTLGKELTELTVQVNSLVASPTRPQYHKEISLAYDKTFVEMPYFAGITIDALYNKLSSSDSSDFNNAMVG